MKTYSAKPDDVRRDWYLVDAEGKTLGRPQYCSAEQRCLPLQGNRGAESESVSQQRQQRASQADVETSA
jgi:hypothetical protein